MGWWQTTDGGYMGDGPADIMGEAIDEVVDLYKKEIGRPPTFSELCTCFGFSTGHVFDDLSDDEVLEPTDMSMHGAWAIEGQGEMRLSVFSLALARIADYHYYITGDITSLLVAIGEMKCIAKNALRQEGEEYP